MEHNQTPPYAVFNIENHYHSHVDTTEILSILNIIKLQNHKIMATAQEQFEEVKAALQTANDKLDTVGTNVSGVAQDVAFLKAKIDALQDGATAEQMAELKTLADSANAKATALATTTGDLDASTDSTAG